MIGSGFKKIAPQNLKKVKRMKKFKRRISFSGRKSVREFHAEEKPKSWNNSYEVSDHINTSENPFTCNSFEKDAEVNNDGQINRIEFGTLSVQTENPSFFPNEDCENVIAAKFISKEAKELAPHTYQKMNGGEETSCAHNNNVGTEIFMEFNKSTCEGGSMADGCTLRRLPGLMSRQTFSPQQSSKTHSRSDLQKMVSGTCEGLIESFSPFKVTEQNKITEGKTSLEYEKHENISDHEYEKVKNESEREFQEDENVSDAAHTMDFTKFQCNSISNNRCNFLFSPTISLKLSLCQLNAAIGDGKIVVFPNKVRNVKDSKDDKFQAVYVEENSSHVPIVPKRSSVNNIVMASGFSEEVSGNVSKCPEKLNTDNSPFFPYVLKTDALSSLNNTSTFQLDSNCYSIGRTLCATQDMSLNVTNTETMTDFLPRSLQFDISEIKNNTGMHMELSTNIQNNVEKVKNRDTIYFYQDMESINSDSVYVKKKYKQSSRSCNDVGINDSFILHLKEAKRAALDSNCEHRIEGTPHRSFLEFVYLEKEVEEDDVAIENQVGYFHLNNLPTTKDRACVQKIVNENEKTLIDSRKLATVQGSVGDREHDNFIENSMILSPIWNSISSKRLTLSLTPNLPLPKRRNTLVFQDCAMDESMICSDAVIGNNLDSNSEAKFDFEKYTTESLSNAMFLGFKNVPICNESNKPESTSECSILKGQTQQSNGGSVSSNPRFHVGDIVHKSNPIIYQSQTLDAVSNISKEFNIEPVCSIIQQPQALLNSANNTRSTFELNSKIADVLDDDPVTILHMGVHDLSHQAFFTLDKAETSHPIISEICNQGGNNLMIIQDNSSSVPNFLESYSALLENETSCKKSTMLCQRCKCGQQCISEALDSFELPSMPPFPSLPFNRLETFRKHLNLRDVHEYWRRKSLEKKNLPSECVEKDFELCKQNLDYIETQLINGTSNFPNIVQVLQKLLGHINDKVETIRTNIYFKKLDSKLSKDFPNWILNYQMRENGSFLISHSKLVSFVIEFPFEDKDQLGNTMFIKGVTLLKRKALSNFCKPIDAVLNSILEISLNFNVKPLKSEITSNISPFLIINRANDVCDRALKDGIDLWRLICKMGATLIKQSHRIFVRKVVRDIVYKERARCPVVIRTEFAIELTNIHTLSFNDILCPPLHAFDEKLQFLPSGIHFLEVFLEDPCNYLKQ